MNLWIPLGAANAFLAVAAGAFGAHGMKTRTTPELLTAFETGARYHMFHALGLVLLGVLVQSRPSGLLHAAGWTMQAGVVLFSGSLYLMALTQVRALGAITPLGGVGFLAAWALLAVGAVRA